jgi:hypothetical protein
MQFVTGKNVATFIWNIKFNIQPCRDYLGLQRRPITGLILIGLGLSSALFHWTGISGWQSVDVVFIYLTLNTIIANFLYKGFNMPRSVLVPSVIVITVIMAYSEPSVNSVIVIGGQFAVLHFIILLFAEHILSK